MQANQQGRLCHGNKKRPQLVRGEVAVTHSVVPPWLAPRGNPLLVGGLARVSEPRLPTARVTAGFRNGLRIAADGPDFSRRLQSELWWVSSRKDSQSVILSPWGLPPPTLSFAAFAGIFRILLELSIHPLLSRAKRLRIEGAEKVVRRRGASRSAPTPEGPATPSCSRRLTLRDR